ncbi:MAG: EamA family transporter [Flavobacteriales bacterium]|nr:EamA family transporter [Flavobacteriales bacterium]
MLDRETRVAYIKMHMAVVLLGLTAIFGEFISFQALPLVWHRLWIAVLGLLFIPGIAIGIKKIEPKQILIFASIGFVVGIHWICFYSSIKTGNVSIALASFSTSTLFISILEPIITKSKFQWVEAFLGILVIVGLLLILDVGKLYYTSIIWGLLAAITSAFFSTLNKRYIGHYNVLSISLIQLAAAFLLITVILGFKSNFNFSNYSIFNSSQISEHKLFGVYLHSFWYLLALGLLCTSVAYVLAMSALKNLSAFSAGLAVNLEPVYGILMAIWFFSEHKSLPSTFYFGTALILLSVFLHPIILRVQKRRNQKKLL